MSDIVILRRLRRIRCCIRLGMGCLIRLLRREAEILKNTGDEIHGGCDGFQYR